MPLCTRMNFDSDAIKKYLLLFFVSRFNFLRDFSTDEGKKMLDDLKDKLGQALKHARAEE